MGRSVREKAYDRARSKALEDMTTIYPELWEFLLAKKIHEYRALDHPVTLKYGSDNNAVYDKARSDAKTELRNIRPGAWSVLMWAWTQHFLIEFTPSEDLTSVS